MKGVIFDTASVGDVEILRGTIVTTVAIAESRLRYMPPCSMHNTHREEVSRAFQIVEQILVDFQNEPKEAEKRLITIIVIAHEPVKPLMQELEASEEDLRKRYGLFTEVMATSPYRTYVSRRFLCSPDAMAEASFIGLVMLWHRKFPITPNTTYTIQ